LRWHQPVSPQTILPFVQLGMEFTCFTKDSAFHRGVSMFPWLYTDGQLAAVLSFSGGQQTPFSWRLTAHLPDTTLGILRQPSEADL
jgi:acylphosphatase